MIHPTHYVGIDIASTSFTCSIGQLCEGKWKIITKAKKFENSYDSFPQFLSWLADASARRDNAILTMESTGVYGEALAHFLVINGYTVSIEPPLKVKRAFHPNVGKSDPVDSAQITEYAYRFYDQLSIWAPRAEILEQIKVLLSTREQFVRDSTGHKNALKALTRKVLRIPLAEEAHLKAIGELKVHIKKLEDEIERLLGTDPDLGALSGLLLSIPGVGLMLAAHMVVLFVSAPRQYSFKELAAYIGICPYEDSSGSSRHNPSTSRHYGPPGLRKLLFLAALSLRTHRQQFRAYFERKTTSGKSRRLVINNIANKMLKIMCAVVRTRTPYLEGYRSIHPALLSPLTLS